MKTPIPRTAASAVKAFNLAGRRLDRHLRKLDRIARQNACKGDLFIGWDVPTLRSCMPDEYNRLVSLEDALRKARAAALWFFPQPAPALQFE